MEACWSVTHSVPPDWEDCHGLRYKLQEALLRVSASVMGFNGNCLEETAGGEIKAQQLEPGWPPRAWMAFHSFGAWS